MVHLLQTKFSFEKNYIIFIYLLTPSILHLKKILKPIQIYKDVPFLGPKYPNLSWPNFFGTNHYYYFHLPIGPFHCAKFKKILTVDPELWGCTIFGPKMVHLPQFFFWKIIKIILIYLLAPFIVQNFKKILTMDPELWGCAIFAPKMAHFPKWEFFFRNPVNEPYFFHSCLSTCQK